MSTLFIDSNCELWFDEIEKHNVKVINMPFSIGEDEMQSYDCGKKFDFTNFYNRLSNKETCKTHALNPGEYMSYFEPELKKGNDVIYLHFSSNMSGTINQAKMAIRELSEIYPDRKITLVDTLSVCTGAGMICHEAIKMHENGVSDEEIKSWVETNREYFSLYFAVDDLNFLKNGGRISNATAFFGSMLSVKPILKVSDDGKIVCIEKAIGKKRMFMRLLDYFKEQGENVADFRIYVMYTHLEDDVKEFYEQVKQYAGEGAEVVLQQIGPIVGVHCGPHTVGIGFHSKHR